MLMYMFFLTFSIEAKNESVCISPLLLKGDSCMMEHDSYHAIEYYLQYRAECPNDLNTLRKLAACYRLRGDNRKCIASMDSIPEDSLNHEDLRMLFYACQNICHSKTGYWGEQILRQYPFDGEVAASLFAYWNNLKQEENTKTYAKVYRENTDSTNILVNKEYAYAIFLSGEYAKAIPLYQKVIAEGFDNFESNFVLGMCYYNTGKYREAYDCLYKANNYNMFGSPNSNNLYFMGMACKKICETTLEAKEKATYNNLAIKYLNESINLAFPRSRGLYVNQQLAELYYNTLQYEKAGHAFAQCIEYDDEDNPLNYYNAAQMYIAAKMMPQAKLYLQMFLNKANKMKDEKDMAKMVATAKEQLKIK